MATIQQMCKANNRDKPVVSEKASNPHLNPKAHTVAISSVVDNDVEWTIYVHARTEKEAVKEAEKYIKYNICQSDYTRIDKRKSVILDRDNWYLI